MKKEEQQLRKVIKEMIQQHIKNQPLKEVEENFELLSRGTEMGEVGSEDYEMSQTQDDEVDETILSILDNALNDIYDMGYELNSRDLLEQFQKLLTMKSNE